MLHFSFFGKTIWLDVPWIHIFTFLATSHVRILKKILKLHQMIDKSAILAPNANSLSCFILKFFWKLFDQSFHKYVFSIIFQFAAFICVPVYTPNVYIVLYPDSSISAFLAIVIKKKRSYAEELSNELLANTLKNVLY